MYKYDIFTSSRSHSLEFIPYMNSSEANEVHKTTIEKKNYVFKSHPRKKTCSEEIKSRS